MATMNPRWAAAVALAVALAATLTSCSASKEHGWYGQVMTLTPRLCVGRHAATGDCFTGGPAGQVAAVKPGDCVHVVFKPPAASAAAGPAQLLSIKPASAAEHRDDCPGASAVLPQPVGASPS